MQIDEEVVSVCRFKLNVGVTSTYYINTRFPISIEF